jgi:signal transduction histidine kinase
MSFGNRKPLIRTLRARLTVLHVGTLALTLCVFAVLAYLVLSQTLSRHHDDELERQAKDVVQALEGMPLTDVNIQRAFAQAGIGSRLVLVRNSRGELIYRDQILEATEPSLGRHQALVHAAASGFRTPEFFTVDLERSGEVRFICAPLPGALAYVQIGDPVGDVRATQHTIALASLPLIPLVLLFSSYGGWVLANRALAPMRSVTATLEEIQATDLARRVHVRASGEEIERLVATLNQLLDRLQRAFESLRQFAGDVSHQLQTPLTVMKGTAEAALRRATPSPESDVLHKLIDEVDDMDATTSNLRAFALADAPVQRGRPVDLTDLVREAAEIVSALGEPRGIEIRADIQPGVSVSGDAVRLKQIVLNLGDNAIKYTTEGGLVTLRLHATPAEAVLEVADTGAGIAAEHLPRLFDRLYRANSTAPGAAGSGVGLAIVKRIVDAHGGTVRVESAPGRGSTFTVRLARG